MSKRPTCDRCGQVFDLLPTLANHKRRCIMMKRTTLMSTNTSSPNSVDIPDTPSPHQPVQSLVDTDSQEINNANDETQKPIDYNLAVEWIKFSDGCNQGRGLSDKDVQAFLDLWWAAVENKCLSLPFTSLVGFKRHKLDMAKKLVDGMKCVVIRVTSEQVPELKDEVYEANFFYLDIKRWLEKEYAFKDYKGFFTFEAKEAFNEDGDRVYNRPQECEAWLKIQHKIRVKERKPDATIAALQMYSDKTLVSHKGLTAHPIKMTLLNVKREMRIKNISTVALLSSLSKPPLSLSNVVWRLVKLSYMSQALSTLLRPLKHASFTGMEVEDFDGAKRNIYPSLLSYVMDEPESKDVFCIRGISHKNLVGKPCEACVKPASRLDDVEMSFRKKTSESQEQLLFELAIMQDDGEKHDFAMKNSLVPIKCGLWGFNGLDEADACNIQLCLGYESMHNEDLGVFLYIIDNIGKYLVSIGISKRTLPSLYRKMNKRLALMPHGEDFQLPVSNETYFPKHSRVQSKEHRNVMQILPHILHGINDTLTRLSIRWIKLFNTLHRKNEEQEITLSVLGEMDFAIKDFFRDFQQSIGPVMPSKGKTIKTHKLSHCVETVIRLGSLNEYDAQHYENSLLKEKILYKSTNGRYTDDVHLASMARNLSISEALLLIPSFTQDEVNYNTVYKQVAESGFPEVARESLCRFPLAFAATDIVISEAAKTFLSTLLDKDKVIAAFSAWHKGAADTLMLLPRKYAIIVDETRDVQTIRCAPMFHRKPFYDSVLFQTEAAGGYASRQEYGQLRMICKVKNYIKDTVHNLVCVRLYGRSNNIKDPLTEAGCVPLKWDQRYRVVPLANVVRRVYVVPDFVRVNEEMFYVCGFRWNRRPVNLKPN